jgi:hypothetical protein
MAINTDAVPRTPLSTKLVVGLGVLLTAVGGGIAIADHLRGSGAQQSQADVPAEATGFVVPGSEHLIQFVGLLIVGVLIVGFLVVSRSATRRG